MGEFDDVQITPESTIYRNSIATVKITPTLVEIGSGFLTFKDLSEFKCNWMLNGHLHDTI